MKVFFASAVNSFLEREIVKLETDFPEAKIFTGELSEEELSKIDIILGSKIEPRIIEKAESLKVVIVPMVGVDHLPLELMKSRGVRIANSHGNAFSVAERALAMILAFYGRIVELHNDLAMEKWHGFWVDKGLDDSWTSLQNKKISILGAGEIGRILAQLVKPFGCKTLGFKRRINSAANPSEVYGYNEVTDSLEKAVQWGDLSVCLLPLTESTRGIINRRILSLMKGKLLLNLGRGEVIEEAALYEALTEGLLLGAAIDTWYTYPPKGETKGPPSRYPLHRLSNVILSPHVAGFTPQAAKLNMEQALANLRLYLKEGRLIYEVDLSAGY